MRIEYFVDGNHNCPAILFYGGPSAEAVTLINTLRSLAEEQETEVALHQIAGVTSVGKTANRNERKRT